jgi:hypothetical protein
MKLSSLYHPLHTTAVFILHHSAVGGGEIVLGGEIALKQAKI